MAKTASTQVQQLDQRILVLTTNTPDGHHCRRILTGAGISAVICGDLKEVCQEVQRGAGSLLLTEEAMTTPGFEQLLDLLHQPSLSGLPVLMLTSGDPGSLAADWATQGTAHVLLLRRPLQVAALIGVARLALTARSRQLEMQVHVEERRRAEAALRESEQRFAVFMQHLPGAAWIKDLTGRYVYINPEAERIFGRSLGGLKGKTDEEIFPPETALRFRENDERALAEGSVETTELLREPDGIEHFSIVHKFAVPGPGAVPALVGGVAFDITHRRLAEDALRESEHKFRALAENAPVAIGIVQGTRFVYANRSFAELSGYSVKEILSIDFPQMVHPDFRDVMNARAEKRLRGEPVPAHYEFLMLRKDGSTRWIDFSPAFTQYQGGPAIIGAGLDITERKQAEEAIRESEQRFRTLADTVPMMIWQCKPDRSCDYFNRGWLEFTGHSMDQEGGFGWADGVHKDDVERCLRTFTSATERCEPFEMEYRLRHHSGEYRWVLDRGIPRRRPDGTYLGYIGGCIDIHDRKLAQESLRESEQHLRRFYESGMIGVIYWNMDGKVTDANDKFLEMVGYTREELRAGRINWSNMTPAEYQTRDAQAVEELKSGGDATAPYEKEYFRKDGTRIPIIIAGAMLDEARFNGVAFVLDITELTTARRAAEEASHAKDRFLAVLSHELRTPLTPVLAATSMLQKNPLLDERVRDSLEMIRRNVELESRLIDDLLDLSRIARGKIELDKRPVELCSVINRAVEVCRPDIEARRLHFDVDLGEDAPYHVQADIGRLQQVFWNLLKNATKFTPQGGCVGIRCRAHDRTVVAEVNDSGIGIEPDALPRIFDAFAQADRAITRNFGGLGLGLAISKSLVEMHGGTIEAHSKGKGKGATFKVRLPLLASKSKSGRQPFSGAPEPLKSERPLRILVVEDHGDTADMIRLMLETQGHEVQTAGDVASALDLAGKQDFDLLISDLGLPDGSGLDLLRELRARGNFIPGVALSGYGQEEDVRQSRQAGFAAHAVKPVDMDKLLAVVAGVAGQRKG